MESYRSGICRVHALHDKKNSRNEDKGQANFMTAHKNTGRFVATDNKPIITQDEEVSLIVIAKRPCYSRTIGLLDPTTCTLVVF